MRANKLSPATASMVADTCLCMRVQRASRSIGRQFDEAFRGIGINNWQFTLLMSLTRPTPPTVNQIAADLDMDRTTVTKNLQPLERRGLVAIRPDEEDGRARRVTLTAAGHALLAEAMTNWRKVNRAVVKGLSDEQVAMLRDTLDLIAAEPH